MLRYIGRMERQTQAFLFAIADANQSLIWTSRVILGSKDTQPLEIKAHMRYLILDSP